MSNLADALGADRLRAIMDVIEQREPDLRPWQYRIMAIRVDQRLGRTDYVGGAL